MNNLKTKAAVILLCCAAALAGCGNDKNEIGKPIAEHITGKWDLAKSYRKTKGKWVEEPTPGRTITIRPDGSALIAQTDAEGQTSLRSVAWHADDQANELTIGPSDFTLFRLEAGEFEMGFHQAIGEGGETLEGEFKWLFRRMDETRKTLAEKLVGTWNFSKTYEKKDGQWVESSFGLPEGGWSSYKEDGTLEAGDGAGTQKMNWSVDNATGRMHWFADEYSTFVTVAFDDDDTHVIYYTENFDPATGQVVTGEYRDVFVRK